MLKIFYGIYLHSLAYFKALYSIFGLFRSILLLIFMFDPTIIDFWIVFFALIVSYFIDTDTFPCIWYKYSVGRTQTRNTDLLPLQDWVRLWQGCRLGGVHMSVFISPTDNFLSHPRKIISINECWSNQRRQKVNIQQQFDQK